MSEASDNFKNFRSGHVVIVACIAMTWALSVFSIRLHLRVGTKRPFGLDDYACTIAMIFGIVSTAAILNAVHNGLGKHQDTLQPSQLETLLKSTYAASLLYILGVTASKCSMSLLVSRLTPAKPHRLASHSVTCFAIIWGAISILMIAFQCSLPHPWNVLAQDRCRSLMAKWTAIEVFSCIIEATIVGLAAHLLWGLHMPWRSKAMILGIFSSRLLVIIPIGFRIYYLPGETTQSDVSFNGVNSSITTQVVLHFSIMAATFPCMKPFLVAFDKGLEASNLNSTKGVSFLGSSRHGHGKGYILHSVGDDSNKSGDTRLRPDRGETETNIEHTPKSPTAGATRSGDSELSDLMIIRKTQEWQVTNEPQP